MSVVPRLRPAFRVGVTGQSLIDSAQAERLRLEIARILAHLRDRIVAALATPRAREIYNEQPPLLRLISPLGDGADRIVAREALALGFMLEVPMPFEQAKYEQTFGGDDSLTQAASIAEFRELLAAAGPRTLALDGDVDDEILRPHSYEAVGRVVVRNVDLLIAVWDNERPPRGRGGTTDTVHYALRTGVPIWWLNPSGPQTPALLWTLTDLPTIGVPRERPPAEDALASYIDRVMVAPITHHPAHGSYEVTAGLPDAHEHGPDPLGAYLAETAKPNRKYWLLHARTLAGLARCGAFFRRVMMKQPPEAAQPVSPQGVPTRSILRRLFSVFDYDTRIDTSSIPAHLAGIYQQRYRTSYFLVFLLASLTLISLITGLTVPRLEAAMTICEFVLLAGVFLIVLWNERSRWYERYISYRLLGELIRMSQYLQRLGWALPGSRVSNVTGYERNSWVPWIFAAGVRSAPLATGNLRADRVESIKQTILEELIDGQKRYHLKRAKDDREIGWLLGALARWFFLITLAVAAIRVLILGTEGQVDHNLGEWIHLHLVPWLVFLSGFIPSLGVAFFALRAYEQLDVLTQQSHQMLAALQTAEERIRRIDTSRPLATELLGSELSDIATLMLQDVAGWAQLFQMKAVEA